MIGGARRMAVLHGECFRVDPGWRAALAKVGIAADSSWPELSCGQLVSSSSTSRCYRIVLPDGGAVYFKRGVYPRWKWPKWLLRPARAAVEVFAYERLHGLGIPAPDVLAYGERRVCGMLVCCFIVTREVAETMDMHRFAATVWTKMPEPQRGDVYRQIAGALLEQMRVAHAARFFHYDLKWRNILLQRTESGFLPVWIDAPRASFRRFTVRRGVIVDLSGLARVAVSAVSRFDRMRFVCQYLGPGRAPGEAAALYRSVARRLQRRPPRPFMVPHGREMTEFS